MRKQDKILDIVIGVSGSGKTAFAKWHAKKDNGIYLDFDALFGYRKSNYDSSFQKLLNIINNHKNNLFILAGYDLYNCPSPSLIEKKIGCKARFYLCFAAPHIIKKRQNKKVRAGFYKNTISKEQVEQITSEGFRMITIISKEYFFVDTTRDSFEIMTKDKFILRWEELLFLSSLYNMDHDQFYQDIELPTGLAVEGYSESEKTWKRILSMVDFFNKSVLDIGSFHGFFSFKAEDKGAAKVVGIEKNKNAFEVAKKIALLKNSKAFFVIGDIVQYKSNYIYDIVLVLNILHHVSDIQKALKNIFESGRTIIFEIPVEQEEAILKAGLEYNFKLNSRINSHREFREIIILKSPESKVKIQSSVRDEYRFSYKRYRIQQIIKYIKRLKVLYPLRWLVNQIRKKNPKLTGKLKKTLHKN